MKLGTTIAAFCCMLFSGCVNGPIGATTTTPGEQSSSLKAESAEDPAGELPIAADAIGAESPTPFEQCIRGDYVGAAEAVGLVVFVHGLTGNGREYWRSDNASGGPTFWWSVIDDDPAFDGFDKCAVEYGTSIFGNNRTTADIAATLIEQHRSEWSKYPNIVFVAHSLGGIVTRELLLQDNSRGGFISGKTRTVFAIATPMQGSRVANLWRLIRPSDPIAIELSEPDSANQYLTNLQSRWINRLQDQIRTHCVAESRETEWNGVIDRVVVSRNSAQSLCDSIVEVNADHNTILDISSNALRSDAIQNSPEDTYIFFRRSLLEYFYLLALNLSQPGSPDVAIVYCPSNAEMPGISPTSIDRITQIDAESIGLADLLSELDPSPVIATYQVPRDWGKRDLDCKSDADDQWENECRPQSSDERLGRQFDRIQYKSSRGFERFFDGRPTLRVVSIHFSCFQNNDEEKYGAGYNERRNDFERFAAFILENSAASIIAHSRTWENSPSYFAEHVVPGIVDESKALQPVQVASRVCPFRDYRERDANVTKSYFLEDAQARADYKIQVLGLLSGGSCEPCFLNVDRDDLISEGLKERCDKASMR